MNGEATLGRRQPKGGHSLAKKVPPMPTLHTTLWSCGHRKATHPASQLGNQDRRQTAHFSFPPALLPAGP